MSRGRNSWIDSAFASDSSRAPAGQIREAEYAIPTSESVLSAIAQRTMSVATVAGAVPVTRRPTVRVPVSPEGSVAFTVTFHTPGFGNWTVGFAPLAATSRPPLRKTHLNFAPALRARRGSVSPF